MGALILAGGCGVPGKDHGRVESSGFDFGGNARSYHLYLPPHPQGPLPLVILLHGAGGDGKGMEAGTGFNAVAERDGLLAAYPDGVDHFWNAGFCCPRQAPIASDDVGFIAALIDRLGQQRQLDSRRVYVAGFSNGGYLAYRLACQLSGRLAAVAAVAADSQECPSGAPTSPVSILHVHGSADNRNRGHVQALRDGTWVETPTLAAEQWSRLDGCPSSPVVTVRGKISRSDWQPCREGTQVSAYDIERGGHTWPRQSPDASQLVAEFFRTQRRT